LKEIALIFDDISDPEADNLNFQLVSGPGTIEDKTFRYDDPYDKDLENNKYSVNFLVRNSKGGSSTGVFQIDQQDLNGRTIKNRQMMEGAVLTSWWHDDYLKPAVDETLQELYDLGTEAVSVLATWYQENGSSVEIRPSKYRTPSDKGVESVINKIKKTGMRTVLKPHIDREDGSWRGKIKFSREEDWARWFQSYTNFMLHYAGIAERNGVNVLVIGTELGGTTHRPEWLEVIRRVKAVYTGTILYGANHDDYKRVPWAQWDLDVGLSAYFSRNIFRNKTEEALNFARAINKKLYFLEFGFQNKDQQAQADFYGEAFPVFFNQPDFGGVFVWEFRHDKRKGSQYSPRDRKAEKVLSDQYHIVK